MNVSNGEPRCKQGNVPEMTHLGFVDQLHDRNKYSLDGFESICRELTLESLALTASKGCVIMKSNHCEDDHGII